MNNLSDDIWYYVLMNITKINAIEIMDSRGKPTIRTFITLEDSSVHSSSVPSGASTGAHEAVELRDGDQSRHLGQGVLKAVANVNDIIAPKIIGLKVSDPKKIDSIMIELDGTENKSKLGANAILSVSMAVTRAAAYMAEQPLWQFINEYYFSNQQSTADNQQPSFPRLMVNIVNGGNHAGWNFDIQEFMIMPVSTKPTKSIRIAAEIFQQLGAELKSQKLSTLVGDEGGYSPALSSNEEVFGIIEKAANKCEYNRGRDFDFAVDCAANEFYSEGGYHLRKLPEIILNSFQDLSNSDDKMLKQVQHDTKKYELTSTQLMEYYFELEQKYSISSFEDPFAEDDWDTFAKFTRELTTDNQQPTTVVGDDIFVTNPKRIKRGIEEKSANAVLIKLNQIGTVTETIEAIRMTQNAGWKVAISHRSGETEDTFIADLAYGVAADFIKTGSMSRAERLAKYNRLIEIENGM